MGKHIIIKEARCSFPRLYGSDEKDGQTFGPGVTLVLEKVKHAAVIAEIKEQMKAEIAGNSKLKASPPTAEKLCLRKPDRDELAYMPDNLILKANNPKAPLVLEPNGKTIMTQATDKIYSGCYINAKIEIWGQANKFGKRVNAKLIAVQYVPKAAESFDGSYVSPDEAMTGFDSLDDGLGDSPAATGEGLDDLLG